MLYVVFMNKHYDITGMTIDDATKVVLDCMSWAELSINDRSSVRIDPSAGGFTLQMPSYDSLDRKTLSRLLNLEFWTDSGPWVLTDIESDSYTVGGDYWDDPASTYNTMAITFGAKP